MDSRDCLAIPDVVISSAGEHCHSREGGNPVLTALPSASVIARHCTAMSWQSHYPPIETKFQSNTLYFTKSAALAYPPPPAAQIHQITVTMFYALMAIPQLSVNMKKINVLH